MTLDKRLDEIAAIACAGWGDADEYQWDDLRAVAREAARIALIGDKTGPARGGLSWDYEESATRYYHVFATTGPLDGTFSGFTIDAPRTPENDADVDVIVEALRRIETRLSTGS